MLKILKSLSKAESLDFLKKNKKKLNIKVPYFFYFTKKEFLKNPNKILKKIIIRNSTSIMLCKYLLELVYFT